MAMKLPFIICFISTFIFFCSSETIIYGSISWWCSQTPHYETCNQYLSRENITITSPTSTIGFLNMAVEAAVNEALVVRERAHEIESKYPNAPGKGLWSSCVDYFDEVVFTLNMVFDLTLEPTPLDIQTWLGTSLAYINVCEKGFELINMTNLILPVISNNLRELIDNSLAISVVNRGSNTPAFEDWDYENTYKLLDKNLALKRPNAVVAQDGTGDFTTVQDAVNAGAKRTYPTKRFVIYVKAGIYTENVVIPSSVRHISMYGDGMNKTIITGSQHSGGKTMNTAAAGDLKSTSTFQVWGRGFIAQHMTFRNTAGPDNGQAIAFLSSSDYSILYRCSFEGYQDTLFALGAKQFYKECQIYGTVDFIFGDAAAVFQDCDIFLRRPTRSGLVVTAHGRGSYNESSAFSLQGCNIAADAELKPILGKLKVFLGRPWFAYATTVVMQSYLPDFVDPLGWMDSWGHKNTCYCGEYKNRGPGSSTTKRVKWPTFHIMSKNMAEKFTVASLLLGNNWIPRSGVPCIFGLENK